MLDKKNMEDYSSSLLVLYKDGDESDVEYLLECGKKGLIEFIYVTILFSESFITIRINGEIRYIRTSSELKNLEKIVGFSRNTYKWTALSAMNNGILEDVYIVEVTKDYISLIVYEGASIVSYDSKSPIYEMILTEYNLKMIQDVI